MRPVAARGHIYKPPPAAGNGLLNNLIGYWGLDEAAGANNALDKHSNALTLTHAASPGSSTGKVYAGARTLNGSTQSFSRTSETLLQSGDVDYTLAAWVYLSAVNINHAIVSKYVPYIDEEFILYYNYNDWAPAPYFTWIFGGGVVRATSFGAASANTWYLVVAWHDSVANQLGISVNGTENTASYSAGVTVTGAAFRVGLENTIYPFSGRIGPVSLWKSAGGGGGVLNSTKRTTLYNAGAGLAYASFTT
jgi:hypothetical protein